jgi:putative transposase
MSTTLSTSSGFSYGVARVCRVWGIPRSSYYDWMKHESMPFEERPKRTRPGPTPAVSDEELESSIREILERIAEEVGITGEGHR